jgi:hypothetical protein
LVFGILSLQKFGTATLRHVIVYLKLTSREKGINIKYQIRQVGGEQGSEYIEFNVEYYFCKLCN